MTEVEMKRSALAMAVVLLAIISTGAVSADSTVVPYEGEYWIPCSGEAGETVSFSGELHFVEGGGTNSYNLMNAVGIGQTSGTVYRVQTNGHTVLNSGSGAGVSVLVQTLQIVGPGVSWRTRAAIVLVTNANGEVAAERTDFFEGVCR